MTIELVAPAKLNLTLEIMGKREDGYHEIRTLIQTINLVDIVRLAPASEIQLVIDGVVGGMPADPTDNLAYRAATMLAETSGRSGIGATITLTKAIPPAGGLGGGSSDAAGVLRGLNVLWGLGLDTSTLSGIAAKLGSDVPFFLHGGTAVARGRGEVVQPLADARLSWLTIFVSDAAIEEKTKTMYSLVLPGDYTAGAITNRACLKVEEEIEIDLSDFYNAFDGHIATVAPDAAAAMDLCREAGLPVYTAGSGPCFYSPAPFTALTDDLLRRLEALGVSVIAVDPMTRDEALAMTITE